MHHDPPDRRQQQAKHNFPGQVAPQLSHSFRLLCCLGKVVAPFLSLDVILQIEIQNL